MTELTVVITDVTTPADLARCVHQVTRTVPRDVEVVLVTAGKPRLSPATAKRVRRVRVGTAAQVGEAVSREAVRARTVIALRADVQVTAGWLGQVLAAAEQLDETIGILGASDPHLIVYPASVTRTAAAERELLGVEAVRVAGAARPAAPTIRSDAPPATIAAVLIVKDEEDVLADCLEAVRPFVDQTVVYDTGSTDRTMEIARSFGALVVEGHWDDDFGKARNRALAHATSDWVLSIDADEVLTGDAAALRTRLTGEGADVLHVPLVNATWSGADSGEAALIVRLFRRTRASWVGALHENLVSTEGELRGAREPAPIRLVHSGYTAERVTQQNKVERNVSISRAALDALPPDSAPDPLLWCNYGRSLAMAARYEEALDALDVVREHPTQAVSVVLAVRTAVEACFSLGRLGDVPAWIAVGEQHGEASGQSALWRAQLALMQGDLDAAGEALDRELGGTDVCGVEFGPERAVVLRARLAQQRGRFTEALDLLLDAAQRYDELVPLSELLLAADAASRPLEEVARALPEVFVARSLRECVRLGNDIALAWCTAVWTGRQDARAIVVGCVVAGRLPLESTIVWSLRAREAGLIDHCPLRVIAADPEREPLERAVATAILAEVLLEQPAAADLAARLVAVPPADRGELVAALQTYAPGVLRSIPDLAAVPG